MDKRYHVCESRVVNRNRVVQWWADWAFRVPQPASAAWTATAVREWVVSVAAVDVFAAAAAETPSVASAAHTSDTTVAETLGRW